MVKVGNFYRVYGKDAYIIAYLFKYKITFTVIFCRTILLAKTVKACIIKLLYSNKVYYQINLVH